MMRKKKIMKVYFLQFQETDTYFYFILNIKFTFFGLYNKFTFIGWVQKSWV